MDKKEMIDKLKKMIIAESQSKYPNQKRIKELKKLLEVELLRK